MRTSSESDTLCNSHPSKQSLKSNGKDASAAVVTAKRIAGLDVRMTVLYTAIRAEETHCR